ncbi:MAG: LptA/OstA family protein, partial [Pseudomonadota bacterium]
ACAGPSPEQALPLPRAGVFTGVELAWPARALVLRAARAEAADPGQGTAIAVQATVGGEGSEGAPVLEIRSERASWDLSQQSVVFEGAVEARHGDFTLGCTRLEARFDSPERLVGAEASGDVRVTHRGRVASGQRAVLDVLGARIELTGAPRVQEGGRTLSGERIVLFLDETRLECERCTLAVVPDGAAP